MTDPIDVEALADEVANKAFTDKRLNARVRKIVAALAEDPTRSLPRAFDAAGLEGAYRFFSNPKVTPEEILSSHTVATRDRCANEDEFLVIHDSTAFGFRSDGEREGLGRNRSAGPNSKQTFFAHFSLAVAANGTRRPLGVAGVHTWVRGPSRSGIEYQRWEQQLQLTSERLDGAESAIHVMDREADDYEMFDALIRDGHRFVARCLHNRWLETTSGSVKLHTLFESLSATVDREVPLSRRKKKSNPIAAKIHPTRKERIASLSITAATVALKRPQSRRAHSKNPPPLVPINVVRVWEPNPPAGEEPIQWYLYTTEPIETREQQLAIVDHYRARWVIEEYIKAIKTGCAFEKRQLQDYEALVNLLATFAAIAYRLLLIRSEARRTPDADALAVVSQDELDVLRACGRLKLSAEPTVRQVYLAIAALGGHIKYSGDPGWLTLARGYEKLQILMEGWMAAKLQPRSDQR